MTNRLLDILKLFEKSHVLAVPYKGPVLASGLYQNLSLREFADLDIVVQEKDVVPAADLLESSGF